MDLKEIQKWLTGRTILDVHREDAILSLHLDDGTHLIIYTETFAKGIEK